MANNDAAVGERSLKRDGVCAASLPTTMALTAAMLVQNALKYLLEFGELSYFLGYNGMANFFPSYEMRPNPDCLNGHCRQHSAVRRNHPLPGSDRTPKAQRAEPFSPPESNEFEIVIEPEDSFQPTHPKRELPRGTISADSSLSVADLTAMLKSL